MEMAALLGWRSPLGMEGAAQSGWAGVWGLSRHILFAATADGWHVGMPASWRGACPARARRGGLAGSVTARQRVWAYQHFVQQFFPRRRVPWAGSCRRVPEKCGSQRPNAQSVICTAPEARQVPRRAGGSLTGDH
jgi:hypothetical protein